MSVARMSWETNAAAEAEQVIRAAIVADIVVQCRFFDCGHELGAVATLSDGRRNAFRVSLAKQMDDDFRARAAELGRSIAEWAQ